MHDILTAKLFASQLELIDTHEKLVIGRVSCERVWIQVVMRKHT